MAVNPKGRCLKELVFLFLIEENKNEYMNIWLSSLFSYLALVPTTIKKLLPHQLIQSKESPTGMLRPVSLVVLGIINWQLPLRITVVKILFT